MSSSNLDLVFEEWKASLATRDRTRDAVSSNFDDLFSALKSADASFEEAHVFLPLAIKAHQPGPALAKIMYKRARAKKFTPVADMTEKEFIDSWLGEIADKATSSFFDIFPRKKAKAEEDDEPKVYGSMSVKEYRAQRRHADSYAVLDTAALEAKMLSGTYNPEEDIAAILGIKGDKNET